MGTYNTYITILIERSLNKKTMLCENDHTNTADTDWVVLKLTV